jgi:hypothetical protein
LLGFEGSLVRSVGPSLLRRGSRRHCCPSFALWSAGRMRVVLLGA